MNKAKVPELSAIYEDEVWAERCDNQVEVKLICGA